MNSQIVRFEGLTVV